MPSSCRGICCAGKRTGFRNPPPRRRIPNRGARHDDTKYPARLRRLGIGQAGLRVRPRAGAEIWRGAARDRGRPAAGIRHRSGNRSCSRTRTPSLRPCPAAAQDPAGILAACGKLRSGRGAPRRTDRALRREAQRRPYRGWPPRPYALRALADWIGGAAGHRLCPVRRDGRAPTGGLNKTASPLTLGAFATCKAAAGNANDTATLSGELGGPSGLEQRQFVRMALGDAEVAFDDKRVAAADVTAAGGDVVGDDGARDHANSNAGADAPAAPHGGADGLADGPGEGNAAGLAVAPPGDRAVSVHDALLR